MPGLVEVDAAVRSFLDHADLVMLAVVGLLALSSVASWAIIIEKLFRLVGLRAAVGRIESQVGAGAGLSLGSSALLDVMLAARADETLDGQSPADLRMRRRTAMRRAYLGELRRFEGGLSFLATLASTAPFLGLFGTVWGIMRSFSAIANAQDTSLAVVAPGIAQALFATAIGLGTAIPAVVAYNLSRAALGRCGQRLGAVAVALAKSPDRHP